MAEAQLTPATTPIKPRPHVIRKGVRGVDRWYVYAGRGGPLVLKRDGVRPAAEDIADAYKASPIINRPAPVKKGRGVTYHRPLFIRELIRLGADSDRWTYFIGDGRRAIKIGAAKCVESRLKILQAHNSRRLRVMAVVRGGEALESAYHALFALHRQKNEWFYPHPEIIAEIDHLNKLTRRRLR